MKDDEKRSRITSLLHSYKSPVATPGIMPPAREHAFVEQIVDSIRRVEYVKRLRTEFDISDSRLDPTSSSFDPIRGAALCARKGEFEEAYWIVFLITHFSKNIRGGWRLLRDVYGRLGQPAGVWSWASVNASPGQLERWIVSNALALTRKTPPGGFGNHRKYESIKTTPDVVKSYLSWASGSQVDKINNSIAASQLAGTAGFSELYTSMSSIYRFGRIAKFDYLSMVSNLGLAQIAPDKPYLNGATGPLIGARLLFQRGDNKLSSTVLEKKSIELANHIGIGMQEIEDAMCNWQKSPESYHPFRG